MRMHSHVRKSIGGVPEVPFLFTCSKTIFQRIIASLFGRDKIGCFFPRARHMF